MSDTESIIHLLRNVEWRLRANRLLHELTLSLSIVLTFFIALKVWALFSPLKAPTITFVIAACAFLFTSYIVWRFRKRGTLDQAAASIDRKAGLNDEINFHSKSMSTARSLRPRTLNFEMGTETLAIERFS